MFTLPRKSIVEVAPTGWLCCNLGVSNRLEYFNTNFLYILLLLLFNLFSNKFLFTYVDICIWVYQRAGIS